MVDHILIHFELDNDIIQYDKEKYLDQMDYWDDKNDKNKMLLDFVNAGIMIDEEISKYTLDDDPAAQKKNLRNTFNFQDRAC